MTNHSAPSFSSSSLLSYTVQTFGEATFIFKSFGLRGDLSIEQVAAEVQERQRRIRHERCRRQ